MFWDSILAAAGRMDSRDCAHVRERGWTRLLRRASAKSNELVLEITEQSADGRRFDRRLTLEAIGRSERPVIAGSTRDQKKNMRRSK